MKNTEMGRDGFEPSTMARVIVSPCKGDVLTMLDDRPEGLARLTCNKHWNSKAIESDLTGIAERKRRNN